MKMQSGVDKAKKASPYAIAVVAVVLVLFFSYLNYNGNGEPPETDMEGEWILTELHIGYMVDGEPQYMVFEQGAREGLMASVTKTDEGRYLLQMDGLEYACVYLADTMLTSGIWEGAARSVITENDGVLTLTTVEETVAAVNVMKFERLQDAGNKSPRTGAPNESGEAPQEGDVYKAFIAGKYTLSGYEGRLSDNYELEILRVEPDIMFYNSHSDYKDLDYTAYRVGPNDWIGVCAYADYTILFDLVHYENGVFYSSSYDNVDGDVELWQVYYGDEQKALHFDLDINGNTYKGTSTVYKQLDGKIIGSSEGEVLLVVDGIDHKSNIMTLTLSYGGIVDLAAMVVKGGSEYRFYAESVFNDDDETYWGYYIGTFSSDFRTLKLVGVAESEYGSEMIYYNELELVV